MTKARTLADITIPSGTPVGTTDTQTLTNKTISGASNTFSNIPLSTGVTGTLPIANGGTNSTATPTAGGAAYGTGTALAITSAGTSGQYLKSNGASAPSWATVSAGYTLGTPVATTSGTSVTFTGIPSGVKQLILNFKDFAFDTSSPLQVQLGDAGGIEITGYDQSLLYLDTAPTIAANSNNNIAAFRSYTTWAGTARPLNGSLVFTLESSSTNTWVLSGQLQTIVATYTHIFGGWKSLSQELTQIKLSGSSAGNFNLGEVNIAYI